MCYFRLLLACNNFHNIKSLLSNKLEDNNNNNNSVWCQNDDVIIIDETQ